MRRWFGLAAMRARCPGLREHGGRGEAAAPRVQINVLTSSRVLLVAVRRWVTGCAVLSGRRQRDLAFPKKGTG